MLQDRVQLRMESPEKTSQFAQAIGRSLGPGDVILLEGGVGAGKTHFARCLIQSLLNAPEDVPSPTYTLVQTYETSVGEVWHADLYRLTDISEIDELGLSQAFADAICLIEWPDRLGDQAPDKALYLRFETSGKDEERRVSMSWSAPIWDKKLQQVTHA